LGLTFKVKHLVQVIQVDVLGQQRFKSLQFGNLSQAGLAENALNRLNCLQRVCAHQEYCDAKFVGLLDDERAWTQIARQDQAGCGGLERSQLNIGPVTTGDHGLVGLFPEAAEGRICRLKIDASSF
jgi:hypothetical protein